MLSLVIATALVAAAPELVELPVGETRVLRVGSITRLAVGDPGVADVKTLPNGELLLVGRSEGRTNLIVWGADGKSVSRDVRVSRGDEAGRMRTALSELVPGAPLRVLALGDGRVAIDGELVTLDQYRRFQKVIEGEPVVSLVTLSPRAGDELVETVNRALRQRGLEGARARLVAGTLFLEGQVQTEEEAAQAERLARLLFAGPIAGPIAGPTAGSAGAGKVP